MEKLALRSSLEPRALRSYVARQLSTFFPDRIVEPDELADHVKAALARLDHNFCQIRNDRYFDGKRTIFDHLNTDQYCVFLYYLANTIHRAHGDRSLATRLYGLNKALNGIDLFFEVEMPDVFGVQHPVGTVVGRAKLSNHLFLYQRCTIGGNLDLDYPVLGDGVVLFGDTAVIGRSVIGPNSWISVGTKVVDTTLPGEKIAFGSSPKLILKAARRNVIDHFFRRPSVCS